MTDLRPLRATWETALTNFESTITKHFPGCDKWHWYRACAAIKGHVGRKNDDTSQDVALAASTEIQAAHNEYIRLLHVFYKARDGEGGVLGHLKSPAA